MSNGPVISAATSSLAASGTDNVASVAEGPVRVLIQATGTGMYVGNAAALTGSSTGYPLNANQEYTFDLYPTNSLLSAGSADYTLAIKNTSGSAVTYSYIVTRLP